MVSLAFSRVICDWPQHEASFQLNRSRFSPRSDGQRFSQQLFRTPSRSFIQLCLKVCIVPARKDRCRSSGILRGRPKL